VAGERLNAGLGGRLRLPLRRGAARWAAVALLLALAAGVLYSSPEPGGVAVPCAETPPGPATTQPVGAQPEASRPPAVAPLAIPAGMTGVTVRLADPAVAAVLRAGSRVDLTTTMSPGGAAMSPGEPALAGVLVLAVVPGVAFDEPGAAALLVAVPDNQAFGRPNGTEYQVVVRST
jgi:hypothetical protein